jgi:hypothetical protein
VRSPQRSMRDGGRAWQSTIRSHEIPRPEIGLLTILSLSCSFDGERFRRKNVPRRCPLFRPRPSCRHSSIDHLAPACLGFRECAGMASVVSCFACDSCFLPGHRILSTGISDLAPPHKAGLFSFCRCYAGRHARQETARAQLAPSRHRRMLGHPARCAGAAFEVVGLLSLRPQPIISAFLMNER